MGELEAAAAEKHVRLRRQIGDRPVRIASAIDLTARRQGRIVERGEPKALIERRMGSDFDYRWTVVATADDANPEKFRESTDKATRFDADCWLIELDVADAERFIAQTIASP